MLRWLRKKLRDDGDSTIWDPIPGTIPIQPAAPRDDNAPSLPVPPRPWVGDLEPEHVSALANQVMWARDAIMFLLHQTASHRWDGHDCPVYCVPATLDAFLAQCTAADLRILVATFTKDSVHIGPFAQDFEDADDEPESGSTIL